MPFSFPHLGMNILTSLIKKYNYPIPRYTSYPTVPSWANNLELPSWENRVSKAFELSNHAEGLSLYIHLPFCESLCTYCACNTRITVNHTVEQPYIAALKKEFDLYLSLFSEKPRISEIHLGGGTPTFFSAKNLHDLIAHICSKSIFTSNAQLSFEAHPANTEVEHLQALYDVGFRRLSLGIQDFDPTVQELINRHQTVEQVAQVMNNARAIGYTSINFDLIYGLPSQSLQSLARTLDEVLLLRPDRIAFYSYAHVPWLKPGQRKYDEHDLPKDELKFALYQFGKKIFESAGYFDIGMDHFAFPSDGLFQSFNKGSLHRNFMGYTENHTRLLLALGVSSISDAWEAFAQNEKKLEDYYAALAQNKLPIAKGHLHTETDLNRRSLILELMCKQETKFAPELMNDQAVVLLDELLLDGIIRVEDEKIIVSDFGKSFLRNICAIYDEYLHLDNNRFSLAV
jgi:oxygen-independent coproporphyrinogen-3 oxidase